MRLRIIASLLIVCSGIFAGLAACGGTDGTELPVPAATVPPTATFIPTGFVDPEAGLPEAGPRPDGAIDPVALCGNGVKNPETELCDDGNKVKGDGCSDVCRVEPGWLCTTPGKPCVAIKCGDGVIAGDEDCDDGNAVNGDGCSTACRLEKGFKCDEAGKACTKTTCGDKKKEGTEQCDDGNLDPFDGCNPECDIEPVCSNGSCTSACGDGLKFPSEECDDGNKRDGDGCSANCKLERGFECKNEPGPPPATKELYIAYRDFMGVRNMGGHPDFDDDNNQRFGLKTGLVKNALDMQGKPELLTSGIEATGPDAGKWFIKDATSFSSWYRDTAFSKKTIDKLKLARRGDGTYQFTSDDFFPLDTAPNTWPERLPDGNTKLRNFLFTSELRIPFTYKGDEELQFAGDDDVWVFVNGKLVVDLGGVKNVVGGSVKLDDNRGRDLGLVKGGMYEFVVFQAERNPVASNYTLTLTDFDRLKTTCKSVCGDGFKAQDEVCDDGAANNTGAYGKCAMDCSKRGPFCGDGIVQKNEKEECDGTDDCTADCRLKENVPSIIR
jgi:fibro-slime domain-containing protein